MFSVHLPSINKSCSYVIANDLIIAAVLFVNVPDGCNSNLPYKAMQVLINLVTSKS